MAPQHQIIAWLDKGLLYNQHLWPAI